MTSKSGEQQLLDLLSDVDARLDAERIPGMFGLYVFGGAAAVIAHGSPRGTADIDSHLEDPRLMKKLVEWAGKGTDLARKHGLYFHAADLGGMVMEPTEWKERCVELLKDRFRRIRVFALGAEDLVLTKLARYNDRDRADIEFLARSGKVNPDFLTHLYRAAREGYPGDVKRLDATFSFVLQEHFGRKAAGLK